MRRAQFDMSVSLLENYFQLPKGAEIVGVFMTDAQTLRITVSDPALPEADTPHDCDPTVTHEVIRWSWNIDGVQS
jgi:hypothetical protein